jgi:hypothetical protein
MGWLVGGARSPRRGLAVSLKTYAGDLNAGIAVLKIP